ncbi:MAG: MBL fold metallo-hydrolase [Planctomycetota bacterium]
MDDFRTSDASLHLLTHYHADHRRGIRSGERRPILCSTVTRRLLLAFHGAAIDAVRTIDPLERRELPRDVLIRAYDAHHCPGALMFLIDVGEKRHLHTGDFRYVAEHDRHPELFEGIDTLFLDTTYSSTSQEEDFEHPSRQEAIERILELIRSHPGRKIYLGIYLLGKNRIVQAIHDHLSLKVHMPPRHFKVHQLLGLSACVTRNRTETRVHALPMGTFQSTFQTRQGRAEPEALVILPTGWREGRGSGPNYHYIPYSEHCSSSELRRFVERVAPRNVVETNEFF